MNSHIITLTASELMQAAQVGVMRHISGLKKERTPGYGCDAGETGWQIHIEGACGEYVVSKAFGFFWNGAMEKLRVADAGEFQVRTRSRQDYDLLLHEEDDNNAVFVLVTGVAPTYTLRGWIFGNDGKQKQWWQDKSGKNRPAFFVPQADLLPIADLITQYGRK